MKRDSLSHAVNTKYDVPITSPNIDVKTLVTSTAVNILSNNETY